MKPKVSLIIPVFNVSEYIEKSFQSAISQTYENIEYIIVDDCSSDDSIEKVEKIIEVSPRKDDIKIIKHDINKGASSSRNTGIEASTGNYIYFMDSDDIITPECIQMHIESVVMNNADFSVGYIKVHGKKTIHQPAVHFSIEANEKILKSFFTRKWMYSCCDRMFKKEFLISHGIHFKAGIIYEDVFFLFLVCLHAKKMISIKENTYKYIVRKNSISASKNIDKQISSISFVMNEIIEHVNKHDLLVSMGKEVKTYISFLRFSFALLTLNSGQDTRVNKHWYKKLQDDKYTKYNMGIYSIFMMLPYCIFKLIFKIPYQLYKKI